MNPRVWIGVTSLASLSLFVPAVVHAQVEDASAQTMIMAPVPVCTSTRATELPLIVEGTEAKFVVSTHSDHETRLLGPKNGHLNFTGRKKPRKAGFHVQRISANELIIRPLDRTRVGKTLTTKVQARTSEGLDFIAVVTLKNTADASKAPLRAVVVHKEELLAEQEAEKKKREAQRKKDKERARAEARSEEQQAAEERRLTREARDVLREALGLRKPEEDQARFRPVYTAKPQGVESGTTVELKVGRWGSQETWLFQPYQLKDQELQAVDLQTVEVTDENNATYEARLKRIEIVTNNDRTSYGVIAIRRSETSAIDSLRILLTDVTVQGHG